MVNFLQVSFKKFNDFKIRSIRISKIDLDLIKKPSTGLEKLEIALKTRATSLRLRHFRYKNLKARFIKKIKRSKWFIRRPRWMYRKNKRSTSFYRTHFFLKKRLAQYRASARLRGREVVKKYRVNLNRKYRQIHKKWVRRYLYDKYLGRRKKKYIYYKIVTKRDGIMIKRRPSLREFKKGIRHSRRRFRNKYGRRKIKRLILGRYKNKFRLFRSRRLIRIVSKKLSRRRKFKYRHRRLVMRAYSMRRFYRILFLRRNLRRRSRRVRSNIRVWLLKRKRDFTIKLIARNATLRGKRLNYFRVYRKRFKRLRLYKRLVRGVFKFRSRRSKLGSRLKKNALVMFKQLLRLKPEVRFAARLKFKNLLAKPSRRKFRKHIRQRSLTRLSFYLRKRRTKRRLKKFDKKKIRFFSILKKKKKPYFRPWYKKGEYNPRRLRVKKKKIRNRLNRRKRKLLSHISMRHYRHSLLSKFRRTKFYRRRLSYLSLVRVFKRNNTRIYKKRKALNFLKSLTPFKNISLNAVGDRYRVVRTNRALRRYTSLHRQVFKVYRDYKREKKEIARRVVVKRKRSVRSKRRRRRLNLKFQSRCRAATRRKRLRKLIKFVNYKSSLRILRNKSKTRRRARAFSKAFKKNIFFKKRFLKKLSLLHKRYNIFGKFSRLTYLNRRIKARKLRRKHKVVFTIDSLFYARPKLRLSRQLKLLRKRMNWEKLLVKEQVFTQKRLNKKFSLRLEKFYEKIAEKRLFRKKRRFIKKRKLVRRKRLNSVKRRRSLKLLLLRKLKVIFFAQKLHRRLVTIRSIVRRKSMKNRKRYLRLKKNSRFKKLSSRKKLSIKQLSKKIHRYGHKKHYNHFRRRFKKIRRRRVRFLRRKIKRRLKALKKTKWLTRRLFARPKYHVKPHPLWRRSTCQLSQVDKRRLLMHSQAIKFLKRGLIVKKGFFYNRRRFYKPLFGHKLKLARKRIYRVARTYKRLSFRKRKIVHNYRLYYNIKKRRYMHRKRFFSPKPKRRNKRFVSHLPAVHILQTNSNYFVYILVNKKLIYLKSTGQSGFEGSKRKAPFAVEKLGVNLGNWLLNHNMRYITLRPHLPKLFYVARLIVKGMLKPYRLKRPRKVFNLRTRMYVYHKKPEKYKVEVVSTRRLLLKAHNGLRLPVKRRL